MNYKENAVDPYTQKVAKCLRQRVEASGKTLRQIAAEAGMNLSTLHRLINGQRHITIAYLYALSTPLDFDPPALLNEAKAS